MAVGKTSLREYLVEGIWKYGVGQGYVMTGKLVAKLLEGVVRKELLLEACNQQQIAEAVMKCSGKVFEQTDEPKRSLVAGSRVANLNVAFLAFEINGNRIEIEAVAKEGLIKQDACR